MKYVKLIEGKPVTYTSFGRNVTPKNSKVSINYTAKISEMRYRSGGE
jgi:hypothetical protein